MSWDIILFSSTEKISSVEELNEEKLVPIDFDSTILNYFNSHTLDENNVEITGEDYSFNFFLDEELVSNKLLSLYGENALFQIIRLASKMNWQIFDTGIDKMLDIDNPSINGYSNFQNYLKHILEDKS
jgi:hypothetical protein